MHVVPVYICPNCKDRSVDIDGFEGLTGSDALQCRRCGFGFIFQLLEDYYPAPEPASSSATATPGCSPRAAASSS